MQRQVPIGPGPEHVTTDGQGRVLTGVADGRILRVDLSVTPAVVEELVNTGGRPLGLTTLDDGRILICDARRGLLRFDPRTRALDVLVDRVEAAPVGVCSNVTAGRDGTVFFTSSSSRYPLSHWRQDLAERTASGRLLRVEPDGRAEVLADGLEFANGVVLAPDASHLVVAETGTRRLLRHWLTGPKAGQLDVLADELPGYPDNLTLSEDGTVWVALAAPVNALLETVQRTGPTVRRLGARAAQAVRVRPPRVARILALGTDGEIRHDLRRTGKACRMITSAVRTPHGLVLGSLEENSLTVCEAPAH
ncbi:SMP-30/gluconolactonase/LRE family protein [Streptomyces sp. SID14478]|uniref:SMP-30/gluconolactonase/LRE family protein n=1 Tax=Streptomyces sp. SID14478 TaxID=2706073 RepID=UPI0031BB652E